MAEKKTGKIIYRHIYSDKLELFRMAPQDGSPFPEYKSGQYIALSRDNCKLTKKNIDANGEVKYVYDLDKSGAPKRGTVTHSYSISSAPYETQQKGYLEFYVVVEMIETGVPGRLSESLFRVDVEEENKISYMNRIVGEFILDKRTVGFENVVMIGTGTGLAPFASMMKQIHHEALHGKSNSVRYTLFHANRTYEELGYHQEFLTIQAAQKFDFVYVPSVSRPTQRDYDDPTLGKGRVGNLLRFIFGMPLKEEQDVQLAVTQGNDTASTEQALEKITKPLLPQHFTANKLTERMDAQRTVILMCGSPKVMDDIKYITDVNKIKFEQEEW